MKAYTNSDSNASLALEKYSDRIAEIICNEIITNINIPNVDKSDHHPEY